MVHKRGMDILCRTPKRYPEMPSTRSDISGPYDAVGVRGALLKRHQEFGFYCSDGIPVENADIAGEYRTSSPLSNYQCTDQLDECNSPVLFAGLAPPQFGHVILNSLGRLWALDQLPKDTRLLYLPAHSADIKLYPHLQPVLELLGIQTPTYLHDKPIRYRELYTAPDLFGERHGGVMNTEMRTWFERRIPPKGPISKGRRVYLTRARLGPTAGRYCNEAILERLLARDGFEIVAPERLRLPDQVDLLQNAEVLVVAESSVLHLYGLVQREGQRVIVIQRRSPIPHLIEGQLRDSTAELVKIDCISSIHWPPRRKDNASIATLDFHKLRDALVAQRVLSPNAYWRAPYHSEVSASLHAGLAPGESLIPDKYREEWLREQRQKKRQAKKMDR